MKVVINACFGGFSVSLDAARRMAELGHAEAAKKVAEYDAARSAAADPYWYGYVSKGEGRADPILVRVVEEMGAAANGAHAYLEIVEIPDDVSWHIEEYDGSEHVAEDHRTWPPDR